MAKKKTAPRTTTALVRKGSTIPVVIQVATEIRDRSETAIAHNREQFLIELGTDYCFN